MGEKVRGETARSERKTRQAHLGDEDRAELGIRHVAIIWRILLASEEKSLTGDGIVASRGLDDRPTSFELANLASNLGFCSEGASERRMSAGA